MQKLSLDPLVLDDIDPMLRDSVWLNLQKIQDYVNLLKDATNPTGSVIGLETATVPSGYLLADGSAFSGTTYPDLATYLGGTTLPDYRGKTLVGKDGTTEFATLGQVGGAKTATADLATHNHSHNHGSHVHSHDHGLTNHNHGGGTGVHAHTLPNRTQGTNATHGHDNTASEYASRPTNTSGFTNTANPVTDSVGVANTSQGSNDATATTPTTDATNAGAGGGHNNLQPYRVLNWFIKT